MEATELDLRSIRPSDRERVLEMCSGVWEGRDYIPDVFDAWVRDPSANFHGVEVDGLLVGLQRMRPLSRRLVWYEGLRVAAGHRRQGLARAMVRWAVAEARRLGFEEMRLTTDNPGAQTLFSSEGFEVLVEGRVWQASRMEGGEIARLPGASEVSRLLELARADPAFTAYRGLNTHSAGARDLDEEELGRLAAAGLLRVTAGGRALAALRPTGGSRVGVTFLSGSGGGLQDLLLALRYEADADDVAGVAVGLPVNFPALGDLEAIGYDWPRDVPSYQVFGHRLTAP